MRAPSLCHANRQKIKGRGEGGEGEMIKRGYIRWEATNVIKLHASDTKEVPLPGEERKRKGGEGDVLSIDQRHVMGLGG